MQILELFDKYFLILMLFQAFVYIVVDYRNFYVSGEVNMAKKSRRIGISVGIISIALYVVKSFFI